MNREQIEETIVRVLSEFGGEGRGKELELTFPVEVSARHVHLTDEAVRVLFGEGAELTAKRPLSQPGQFLSGQRVALVTSKGRIDNVAVLGPTRPETQVELSVTDSRKLGINAPLRISGDLRDAGDVYIFGPKGMLHAKGSVIVAKAHIHITPAEADPIGIKDGEQVTVTIDGERSVTFENVICRVSDKAALAMHIDSDEANACCLSGNATAKMRVRTENIFKGAAPCMSEASGLCKWDSGINGRRSGEPVEIPAAQAAAPAAGCECGFDGKLITEEIAKNIAAGMNGGELVLKAGVLVTPAAKDIFMHAGITVVKQ